jgi:hypothetical protein
MFDPINLDCITDHDDMMEAARVLSKLSGYADIKARAMRSRLAGNAYAAEELRSECDEVYLELPEWARW